MSLSSRKSFTYGNAIHLAANDKSHRARLAGVFLGHDAILGHERLEIVAVNGNAVRHWIRRDPNGKHRIDGKVAVVERGVQVRIVRRWITWSKRVNLAGKMTPGGKNDSPWLH